MSVFGSGLGRVLQVASVFAVVLVCAAPLQAQEAEKAWEPPPPMPDKFDWIQLVSGEWLKGEILGMYDGSLDFDVTFVWDRIEKPRPNSDMSVPKQDDFRLNFALGFDF